MEWGTRVRVTSTTLAAKIREMKRMMETHRRFSARASGPYLSFTFLSCVPRANSEARADIHTLIYPLRKLRVELSLVRLGVDGGTVGTVTCTVTYCK